MDDLNEQAASYRLAFDEGARALDAQERAVNELRSRAGILIAAAAIVTSFFGSRVFADGDLSVMSWTAIIAFAFVSATVLVVLWPRSDWEFSASPMQLIATYVEADPPVAIALIHRDLALHRSASYDHNARQLKRLFVAFRAGLVLLVIEVTAWIVAIEERV